MAAKAAANIKYETEGDLQVLYFTLSTVTDGDTTDLTYHFKKIYSIQAISSTKTPFGATESSGTITWKSDTVSSAGAANLICRVTGN